MTKDTSCLGNSSDTHMREYIVTLKDHNDSDGFYTDMETDGGNITIPDRACECCKRREISRNTHYHLTYDEARQVLDDDRVLAVELTPLERGLKPIPFSWEMSSTTFDKRVASDANDDNWGFVTSSCPNKITGWVGNIARDIISEYSGKNVDVLIADDGVPYPSTLEYAQNPDGTGYPRLIQYNWFQHKATPGVYDYSLTATTNEPRLQEHGAHTMGTSAGNTQGWARDANIYFISFYDTAFMDYVRAWHNSKPINPETGIRNPTVMNNSWGYGTTSFNKQYVSEIRYRGTVYSPTSGDPTSGTAVWDQTLIDNFWCTAGLTRVASDDTDYTDAINDGMIIVASAGNSNSYMDVPGGVDYDNYFDYWSTSASTTYRSYPHRGVSPSASSTVICVGAAGSHDEAQGASIYDATNVEDNYYRAEFSNFGPRCDVWAAGAGIQSIWRSTDSLYDAIAAPDARLTALSLTDTLNNNFKKCPGTSMSGPQVCGLLACLAEAYPRMTQADARNFFAKKNVQTMDTTLGGRTDLFDLGTSKNTASGINYAGQWGHRYSDPSLGTTSPFPVPYPESYTAFRPDTGSVYPRSNRLFNRNSSPTYALSVDNNTVTANGSNSATVTLTTTNVPDNTQVPYIITSKYKGAGRSSTTTTDTGVYVASDSSGTYSTTITGTAFGDGDGFGTVGTERSTIINMSAASTNPTWIADPNGFSWHDYQGPYDPNLAPAGNVSITVTAPSNAYLISGSDRVQTHTTAVEPMIVVNYGDTLEFTINSGTSHPFYVKYTTANGGTNDQVTAGVTNQGATSGTVVIDTTAVVDSSGGLINSTYGELILYYQCSVHSGMKGIIVIRNRTYPTAFSTSIENNMYTGSTSGDDGFWVFDLPWSFNTFGNSRDKVFLSTNSYITFGSGSTSFNSFTSIPYDKILLSSTDGRASDCYHMIKGTAPNRVAFFEYYGYTTPSSGGEQTYYQLEFKENDPNNIYLSVLMNGNYTSTTTFDRYPFYQDEILGGTDITGVFTVNSNTATLTITPDASYTNPDDGAMNVNVRLDMFNTPEVDFNVTS